MTEDAVRLVDDGVAFKVVEDPAATSPALGDQLGVEGLSERLRDAGESPSQSSSCSPTMTASGLCPLPFLAAIACPVLDTGAVSLWTPFTLPFPLLLPFLFTMSVSFCLCGVFL